MRLTVPMIVGAVVLAGAGYIMFGQAKTPDAVAVAVSAAEPGASIVKVKMPELAGNAQIGQRVFGAKCAACHGQDAGGLEGSGPPLIHKTYRPGHHADEAFRRAARNGVQSHHWRFGNMPKIEGVTDGDITMVVAYIRALQQENGIK